MGSPRRWGALAVIAGIGLAGVACGISGAVASAAPAAPLVPLERIPAHLLPSGTPVPVPPGVIKASNDWLVSDGGTLVAVYAGTDGSNPANGRFVIVRQNAHTGRQTIRVVNVPGARSVSIISPPRGARVETSAQRGGLDFITATGARGVLHLNNDSTS
jgi:hypothetical protein